MKYMKKLIAIIALLFSGFCVMSQTGSGSYETSYSSEYIRRGNYKFVYSESPYLGSDADWEIDGEVYVYSRNIWISLTAKASGSGTLYVRSPGDNPFYEDWIDGATYYATQTIDGYESECNDGFKRT